MNSRIKLYSWHDRDSQFIDINWPKVHKTIGVDQTKWFLSKDLDQCQLVIDKIGDDYTLVAEIYDEKTLVEYHLMWAK